MHPLRRFGQYVGVLRPDGRPFTDGQLNPPSDPPPSTWLRRLGQDLGLLYREDGSWSPVFADRLRRR